jgi:hypothetical protein
VFFFGQYLADICVAISRVCADLISKPTHKTATIYGFGRVDDFHIKLSPHFTISPLLDVAKLNVFISKENKNKQFQSPQTRKGSDASIHEPVSE